MLAGLIQILSHKSHDFKHEPSLLYATFFHAGKLIIMYDPLKGRGIINIHRNKLL